MAHQPTVFAGDSDAGPDCGRTGARGDPSLAAAEKGRLILETMAGALGDGLWALFPEALSA